MSVTPEILAEGLFDRPKKQSPLPGVGATPVYISHDQAFGVLDSLAAGLSRRVGASFQQENLFIAPSTSQAFLPIGLILKETYNAILALSRNSQAADPEFVFLVRGPFEAQASLSGIDENLHVVGVSSYDMLEDGKSVISVDYFFRSLHSEIKQAQSFIKQIKKGSRPRFRYVLGYMDANPNPADGHVRGMRETLVLAAIFSEIRESNRRFVRSLLPKKLNEDDESLLAFNPFFTIEHNTFYGQERNGQKAYSFLRLKQQVGLPFAIFKCDPDDPSTTGFAVLASTDFTFKPAPFEAVNRIIGPTLNGVIAASFAPQPCAAAHAPLSGPRENSNKERLTEASRLIYAMINGAADDFLTSSEVDKAKSWIQDFGKLSEEKASKLLDHGIPGFRALNLPDVGHHLILEYEQLMNWHCKPSSVDTITEFDNVSATQMVRDIARRDLNLDIGDLREIGYDESFALCRFSLNNPPDILVARILKLVDLSERVQQTPPFRPLTPQSSKRFETNLKWQKVGAVGGISEGPAI